MGGKPPLRVPAVYGQRIEGPLRRGCSGGRQPRRTLELLAPGIAIDPLRRQAVQIPAHAELDGRRFEGLGRPPAR
jgi:hypothetical protein